MLCWKAPPHAVYESWSSCYLTWMRGAIWRAATSLPSQPEAAVGRQQYRSRVLLRMPRFESNLARPARKVKHTLACAVPPSVRSRPHFRFRSTQTSALGRLQPFRASLPKPHLLHRNNQDLVDYFSAKLDQSPQTRVCLSIGFLVIRACPNNLCHLRGSPHQLGSIWGPKMSIFTLNSGRLAV